MIFAKDIMIGVIKSSLKILTYDKSLIPKKQMIENLQWFDHIDIVYNIDEMT